MKAKGVPVGIIVLILVLGCTAKLGVFQAAAEMGFWHGGWKGSLYEALGTGVIFGLVPILAIYGLCKRRLFGLYLGLVPLILVFGFSLRLTTDLLASQISPYNSSLDVFARMASVGFVISLGLFIIKLGFSKTVATYFEKVGDS